MLDIRDFAKVRTPLIPDDYPEPSVSLSFVAFIIYPLGSKMNKQSFLEYTQNCFFLELLCIQIIDPLQAQYEIKTVISIDCSQI